MGEGIMIYGMRTSRRIVRMSVKDKVLSVYNDVATKGYSKMPPFSLGHKEKRLIELANRVGEELAKGDIYFMVKQLRHARRPAKIAAHKDVPPEEIAAFSWKRHKMDLFYDVKKRNFIYTDYTYKYVIDPRYEMKVKGKKIERTNFLTASRVTSRNDFNGSNFKR